MEEVNIRDMALVMRKDTKTYSSSITNLKGLEDVKGILSGVLTEEIAIAATGRGSICELERADYGCGGGSEVRDDTSKTDTVGLLGDVVKSESVPDDFLCRERNPLATDNPDKADRGAVVQLLYPDLPMPAIDMFPASRGLLNSPCRV